MEQTPLEKAIAELEHVSKFMTEDAAGVTKKCIEHLTSTLPYEKTYHRNIAENAWDAAIVNLKECNKYESEMSDLGCSKLMPTSSDKQTYLNQNHPL